LGSEVKLVEESGGDLVHIDIMDGHFVPNLTIGPSVVSALRKNTKLPFDVHLMISEPDKYIEKFIDAGADIIAVHPESCIHLHRTLMLIKAKEVKVGIALNPSTSLTSIEPVLSDLDMLVIMTVNPGFPAQKFIKSMVTKIKKTHELLQKRGLSIEIEVDGGINVDTAPLAVQAGADILVAGNAAFHGPAATLAENIKLLKEAASK
jgi:ribulose-phosphate 3-epimerase